jgi:sulfur carrier protein ThiS adenylyltransferase
MISIFVNEQKYEVSKGTTFHYIKNKVKDNADIIIINGYPVDNENDLCKEVNEGDHIILIKRGEIPSLQELESLMIARHTPGVYEKVKKTTVGIAGLGGLGSTVAIALARIGIGKLVLVDFDVVEPSNLNRQQYYVRHIGRYKVDAIREIIEEINPYVVVDTHLAKVDENNVSILFRDVDILVEAFDTTSAKRMLIEKFHKCYPIRPIVSASGLAGYYSSNLIKVRRVTPYLYIVGDEEHSAEVGIGLMSPRVGIAGNMQANTVLRIIMNQPDP